MTKHDVLAYWRTVASDDWETAQTLLRAKRYHHALFFCHLSLEKLLKGLVWKHTNNPPLPIHDLVKLATQAAITLTVGQKKQLGEITTWNVNARYDSIKREFYRKATQQFTEQWMGITKEFFLWLTKQY